MILFSSRKLEAKLAKNELSEWQKAWYLILPSLFFGPLSYLRPRFGASPTTMDSISLWVSGVLIVIVTYIGLRKIYKINAGIDGKDFITRCTILGLPVGIRFFLISILTMVFIIIILGIIFYSDRDVIRPYYSPIIYTFLVILTVFLYASLVKSFKRFGNLLKQTQSSESQ